MISSELCHFLKLCHFIKWNWFNTFFKYYFSALKYSERRAFHCRIDAEHNSSPTARLSAADPSQCNVSVEEVGRFFIITSNGLPDHEVHSKKIKSQNIELSIPKVPTIMEVKKHFGND